MRWRGRGWKHWLGRFPPTFRCELPCAYAHTRTYPSKSASRSIRSGKGEEEEDGDEGKDEENEGEGEEGNSPDSVRCQARRCTSTEEFWVIYLPLCLEPSLLTWADEVGYFDEGPTLFRDPFEGQKLESIRSALASPSFQQ
eukprot:767932-Hanusia_phi.AAC.1